MDLDEALAQFAQSLGLPKDFIIRLRHEGDDWTFIIKAHALVETGLTEVLVHQMGHPELEDKLVLLPITGQFSKLSIIEAFKLLPDDKPTMSGYIKTLGTLRNRCVHNIKRVDFSLATYFQELSSADPQKFTEQHRALDLIFQGSEGTFEVDGQKLTPEEIFKTNPRLVIAGGLKPVLWWIQTVLAVVRAAGEMRKLTDESFTALVLAELSKRPG